MYNAQSMHNVGFETSVKPHDNHSETEPCKKCPTLRPSILTFYGTNFRNK